MATTWYALLAGTIAVYVVLDGFELGVGIVHRLVGRTREERGLLIHSIGPVWDGNEVWLIAAGTTFLLAFPAAFASAMSGLYLPLNLVLWLLIGRACAVELGRQVVNPAWETFWDAIFALSSLLLAFALGVVAGIVLRGVPLAPDGTFFLPLWAHGPDETGVLDGFTVLAGAAVVVALAYHGAIWTAFKHEDPIRRRARRLALGLWFVAGPLAAVVTMTTGPVGGPGDWLFAFVGLGIIGWFASGVLLSQGKDFGAFVASSLALIAMVGGAASRSWPYLLRGVDGTSSFRVEDAAAPQQALEVGLLWWIPGILLAIVGQAVAYHVFRGKARAPVR